MRAIRGGSLLLGLSWLLALGSAFAQSPVAPATRDIDASTPAVTARATHSTSSASIEREGACSEEVVDPLEDEHLHATAQLVALSPAALETSISLDLHPATPVRTLFIDSAAARGPPST